MFKKVHKELIPGGENPSIIAEVNTVYRAHAFNVLGLSWCVRAARTIRVAITQHRLVIALCLGMVLIPAQESSA